MTELTQEEVNETCESLKKVWDANVAASGMSEQMFIILDKTGFSSQFLYNYSLAKENVESMGLVMPELVKGITVREVEEE
jgi:hypothetical protein